MHDHRFANSRTTQRVRQAALPIFAILFAGFPLNPLVCHAECIWIEAEAHTTANFEHFEVSSMGKPEMLSGGEWLMKGMSPEEVKKLVPADGIVLKYDVVATKPGPYNLWARVGWFRARADFQWRLNGGPWHEVPKTYPTTNLMELGFFCEVSWADLGKVSLKRGRNELEIRYPKTTGEKERMLVALDCLAFLDGPFTPEGPFKPGQTYDGEVDKQAARHIFRLPAVSGAQRVEVDLSGPWQVARYDDPNMDRDTYVPVQRLPGPDEYELRWMGFEVPGSPWANPPLVFGHRLIYRTHIDVPAGHEGRAFKLHFSGTNWIVSVFVNGQPAGTHKGVWVPWDLDVSPFIEPGKVNELAVAVKGTYYALDANALGGDKKLESHRNRPLSRKDWTRWVAPMYPSTKGDGDGYEYGIVNPVTLVSTGPVYTEDVFIKPSVSAKRLDNEVTLRNATDEVKSVSVTCAAVHDKSGAVERTFGPVAVELPPLTVKTVSVGGSWKNPKLWWPQPNPDLYRLRTTISEQGKVVDVHEELFGFREVSIEGPGITINGVRRNFWNWVDIHAGRIAEPEDWARIWRQDRSRFMRFSHGRRITQKLKTREERLEFYDRNGVPGRLCTMIDGMFITFDLGLRTQDEKRKPLLIPNDVLWANFREHMAQVAKAYRNHPSVIFYQVENELVYINGMNIYGSYLDRIEELMSEVCEAGRANDPTRPYTVGGGGDLSGRLEINSPHYPHTAFDYYPENAYTLEHYAEKIKRWPWDRTKPWVVGESCFANELAFGAYVAGDDVFRGADAARRGKARFLRMLYGGYRWAGVAGFFPWDNLWNYEDARKVFSDLCVVPRKQTARLFAGRRNELLVKVMNDTLSHAPVTLTWSYAINGRTVAGDSIEMDIEPGFGKEHTIAIDAPKTAKRLEGLLTLTARQGGAEDYVDQRVVPVLPGVTSLQTNVTVHVLDRRGELAQFLQKAGLTFRRIESLDQLEGASGLLLIGRDTLSPDEAFGTKLLGFAAPGGKVLVLEQENAPAGAALSAPIKPTSHFGGYAHPQALGTPIYKDLGKEDLIDWAGSGPTYKNVYLKPSQGGRSLAECGGSLEFSPLIEVPCGAGVMVLCQLRLAEKLGVDPAADVLLRNLIDLYCRYRPSAGKVALVSSDDAVLTQKVHDSGALVEPIASVGAALDAGRFRVALVHATQKNLQALLKRRAKVAAFQRAGGWVMLMGLTPEGIDEFNQLVDADYMLRPFRVERVTLENPDYALAATLGNRDVALQSPQGIMHGRYWVSGNTFSYVIDNQDFAPFTRPPEGPADPYEYKPTFDDHDPFNFVNGMISSDFWRYIRQIWVPQDQTVPLTFTLRRPDVVKTINIWNNENYWTVKDLGIYFDGNKARSVHATLPDSSDFTIVELPEPVRVEENVTLEIRSWRRHPLDRKELRLVGIDNVQFLRPAPKQGAIFLDNVGGLVAFPRGSGGLFLCQLKFMADEPRPENADKKLRILSVLLQNMGVGSRSAAKVAVPGVNVRFTPINIQEYCNAYLAGRADKAGWFGDKNKDMKSLPRGRAEFADVAYHVVDYLTAPIPDCIILGGQRAQPRSIRDKSPAVAGIKVGRKADLLYSLHTAHVARPITDRERRQMLDRRRPFVRPSVFKYVLHYADGATAEIPVVLEKHIDHWLREDPKPLEAAQVGWSRPVTADSRERAVLYTMQAMNPRPDAVIDTIEIARTSDRATPAIVAVTLGEIVGKQ